MSTRFEKIEAQSRASSASEDRHLIGPVELGALFDEVGRLRERIRQLTEAGDYMVNALWATDKQAVAAWKEAKEAKP